MKFHSAADSLLLIIDAAESAPSAYSQSAINDSSAPRDGKALRAEMNAQRKSKHERCRRRCCRVVKDMRSGSSSAYIQERASE